MEPALCLTFCRGGAALLLGAFGLGLTLKTADTTTCCYKSKVIGHGITPCWKLEEREKIYYAKDLISQSYGITVSALSKRTIESSTRGSSSDPPVLIAEYSASIDLLIC